MDSQLQVREKTDQQRIKRYAALMTDGVEFPPIVVFEDGETFWLGDGKHRTLATQCNGCESMKAEVRQGTERDAFLYGLLVNGAHGLSLTNTEKRTAIDLMLQDSDWSTWSDREIARQCGVSNAMVSKRRKQTTVYGSQSSKKRKVKRGDQTIEMDTTNIGKGGPSSCRSEAITEVGSMGLGEDDQMVETSMPGELTEPQEPEVGSYRDSCSEHVHEKAKGGDDDRSDETYQPCSGRSAVDAQSDHAHPEQTQEVDKDDVHTRQDGHVDLKVVAEEVEAFLIKRYPSMLFQAIPYEDQAMVQVICVMEDDSRTIKDRQSS